MDTHYYHHNIATFRGIRISLTSHMRPTVRPWPVQAVVLSNRSACFLKLDLANEASLDMSVKLLDGDVDLEI